MQNKISKYEQYSIIADRTYLIHRSAAPLTQLQLLTNTKPLVCLHYFALTINHTVIGFILKLSKIVYTRDHYSPSKNLRLWTIIYCFLSDCLTQIHQIRISKTWTKGTSASYRRCLFFFILQINTGGAVINISSIQRHLGHTCCDDTFIGNLRNPV